MTGILICFSGIDGSGKSTHAKYLVDTLNQRNIKAKFVYGRFVPKMLRPIQQIANRIYHLDNKRTSDYTNYRETKQKINEKHRILAWLYHQLLIGECVAQLVWNVVIPLQVFNKVVVCDRYILDTVVTDLAVDFDYSLDEITGLTQRLYQFLPRPDFAFLIDIPEEIAFQRKDDTPSIQYLTERRHRYLDVGKEMGYTILDGSKQFEELRTEINQKIGEIA